MESNLKTKTSGIEWLWLTMRASAILSALYFLATPLDFATPTVRPVFLLVSAMLWLACVYRISQITRMKSSQRLRTGFLLVGVVTFLQILATIAFLNSSGISFNSLLPYIWNPALLYLSWSLLLFTAVAYLHLLLELERFNFIGRPTTWLAVIGQTMVYLSMIATYGDGAWLFNITLLWIGVSWSYFPWVLSSKVKLSVTSLDAVAENHD